MLAGRFIADEAEDGSVTVVLFPHEVPRDLGFTLRLVDALKGTKADIRIDYRPTQKAAKTSETLRYE